MRISLLMAAMLGLVAVPGLADTSAPVTAVVLYPGSATIVRTAQVAAGATEVQIGNLPANFRVDTLRVQAGPGIRIVEVITRDVAGTELRNQGEADLSNKIEAMRDQQAVLAAEIKSAEIVKGYLERFNGTPATADKAGSPVDAKALGGLIDTLGRGASEALVKIQKLTVQQRELRKKIDAMQRDMERLQSGSKDTRSVTVRLAASSAGSLTLRYQLDNAGWKPHYRAGLNSAASTVELERLATVAQKTGEDWKNVSLTLSTSRPSLSAAASEPRPWLLSYRPPAPPPAPAPQAVRAGMVMADDVGKFPDSNLAEPLQRIAGVSLKEDNGRIRGDLMVESQGAFGTEFEVPGRVTLASDGREILLPLSKQTLPVTQYSRVTPRLEKYAIVMADAARPDGVWPAGKMQLYRDGGYIGEHAWNLDATPRTVLPFGRDDLLTVTLNTVDGKSGSKGFFGDRASRNSAEVFSVTSRHKGPHEVLVLESSPVSTSELIKVQATFDPKPVTETWEERRGVVAWKRSLAPGETAKFQVEYRIDFPKDGMVSGLR